MTTQVPRDSYSELLHAMQRNFGFATARHNHLFITDTTGLFEFYLDHLPAGERQHHNCRACHNFVQRYGGLVAIDDNGTIDPVMWGPAPGFYNHAFKSVHHEVTRRHVTGVFISDSHAWGTPRTEAWQHMHVIPEPRLVAHRSLSHLTPGQLMAAKREDYRILQRALADYGETVVDKAFALLRSDAMFRSEKCLGVAQWLADLHTLRDAARTREHRDNITWLAVASAPAGYCNVRSTMIGTLLDDISRGMDTGTIIERFRVRMDPTQYRRPTAAPSTAEIDRAEDFIVRNGYASALRRRFAWRVEIQTMWAPKSVAAPAGVFAALKKQDAPMRLPVVTITWEKFARTVLPTAESIEVAPPTTSNYAAFVTAVDPDAKPIFQWDNPFSWYVYNDGSLATQWNLYPGVPVPVTGIAHYPHRWHHPEKFKHFADGVIIMLQGCRDTRNNASALFPECLRSELREAFRSIEKYSRITPLEGREEASACGIAICEGGRVGINVKVTTNGGTIQSAYRIDRWD